MKNFAVLNIGGYVENIVICSEVSWRLVGIAVGPLTIDGEVVDLETTGSCFPNLKIIHRCAKVNNLLVTRKYYVNKKPKFGQTLGFYLGYNFAPRP